MLYPSTVLAIPNKCIDEYNMAIIKFLCDQKLSKAKYKSLINTVDNMEVSNYKIYKIK